MHVSVGRLRLEPGPKRLRFLFHGALAYLQARRASGVIHASVYREDSRTYWSMSVWISREAMLAYRNSGSHHEVMTMMPALGARIDFLHWQSDTVPSWEAARLRLREHFDTGVGGPAGNEMHPPSEACSASEPTSASRRTPSE